MDIQLQMLLVHVIQVICGVLQLLFLALAFLFEKEKP